MIRAVIEDRLEEFKKIRQKGEGAVFEELIFSILAAGTSALMAQKALERVRPLLNDGSAKRLTRALRSYRFPKQRALCIVSARKAVKDLGMDLTQWLAQFENLFEMREACIRTFRGLGYKTASHFLRNIGYFGLAILDIHVVRTLFALGVLPSDRPPSSRKRYLEAEEQFLIFADKIGVRPEALDLVLWASRTGYVFK
ncbi:MAG: DNA lyase [Armatimonadetes bacterium]|nr:DNA lyase [Armatimonadota bacterium]MDW8121199.1 DNA lyase [Armatimonadota bacterium]